MGTQRPALRRSPRRKFMSLLQHLESRQLLSQTINVTSYGANGNDTNDDRAAIVAAINASGDGDTIYFPAGNYYLSKEISSSSVQKPLGHGRIYKGDTTFITNPNGTYSINDRSILLSTGTDPSDPTHKVNDIFHFSETNPNPTTFNVKF